MLGRSAQPGPGGRTKLASMTASLAELRAERRVTGTARSPGIATAKGVSDRRAHRRHQPLYSAMS